MRTMLHIVTLVVAIVAPFSPAVAATPPRTATPPAPRAPTEPAGWWATITANDVYVRSAPSVDSAYPFLKLDRDAMVRVVEENVGWARVPAVGPAFKDAFGYVKADRKLKVSADGKTAEVLTRCDVLAPNLPGRFNPDSSWRSIGKLEPGQTTAILDTIEGQRDTVYKVPLPANAEGWVNLTFLRKSSSAELATLDPKLVGAAVEAAPAVATPAATNESKPVAVAPAGNVARTEVLPEVTPAPPSASGSRPGDPPATFEATTTVVPDDTAAAGTAPPEATSTPPAATAVTPGPVRAADGGTAPITAPVPAPSPPPAPRIEQITLADIEAAFERLKLEDPETAEVGPLRQRYLEFSDRPTTSPTQRDFARTRAEQLKLKEEIQDRIAQVKMLIARSSADLEVIRGSRVAMDARQPYIAVGRLNASTIYDGVRLPLLFRIQDPTGGQSIGYLQPGQGFDLTALLGQLVGVVGTKGYDEALRLNIIAPTRIDVLGKK